MSDFVCWWWNSGRISVSNVSILMKELGAEADAETFKVSLIEFYYKDENLKVFSLI